MRTNSGYPMAHGKPKLVGNIYPLVIYISKLKKQANFKHTLPHLHSGLSRQRQ